MTSYSSATPRESSNVSSPSASSQVRNYIHFGSFHLDVQRRELFKDGLRIKVQSKVVEALLILVENPGQIITREILRDPSMAERYTNQLRRKRQHHGE